MLNLSKPTTTLANTLKVFSFESWSSIATTWTAETRTWDEMASNWDGFTKPTTVLTNVIKPTP